IKVEPLDLPPRLDKLHWVDFTDAAKDADNAEYLARLIRSADAEDARKRRGFRPPPEHGQPGCFPRPPQYGFQGRARELYDFESALLQFNDGTAAHGSPYTDEERRRLADLFQDLTTGPGRGRLLVTCRPGETGLSGAQRLELHGLARPDSLWLLHRILERDGR